MLDLCHTLYLSNTTFDFLNFYLTGYKKRIFIILRANFLLRKVNALSVRLFRWDIVKSMSVSLLKGYKRSELESSARDFIETIKINSDLISFIESRKSNYHEIIIVSASLDFIVKAVAQKHKYDGYMCSELKYTDGVCTGKYEKDILYTKIDCISEGFDLPMVTFISDNYTDLVISEFSAEFFAVYHCEDNGAKIFWNNNGVFDAITYK